MPDVDSNNQAEEEREKQIKPQKIEVYIRNLNYKKLNEIIMTWTLSIEILRTIPKKGT